MAYALTPPGTAPSEQALRLLINADKPEDVTAGQLASIRRLVFEAQTLSVSQLKQQVEGADSKVRELPADERRFRLAEQKQRLAGMELKGPLECSFGSYNMVVQMASQDVLQYMSPNKFTTRAQEVLSQKPQKDLILDASHSVKVRDSFTHNTQCDIADPLALSQALTRRSLALDLVGIASFPKAESWNRELLRHLQQSPPPVVRWTWCKSCGLTARRGCTSRKHFFTQEIARWDVATGLGTRFLAFCASCDILPAAYAGHTQRTQQARGNTFVRWRVKAQDQISPSPRGFEAKAWRTKQQCAAPSYACSRRAFPQRPRQGL